MNHNFQIQSSNFYNLWFYFLTWESIEEKKGDNVIGCLWEIDLATIDDLDEQEGVSQNIYQPMEVTVVRGSGKSPIGLQVYSGEDSPSVLFLNRPVV